MFQKNYKPIDISAAVDDFFKTFIACCYVFGFKTPRNVNV